MRNLKYIEAVNKIDEHLNKMMSGKVDISKDLPKLKELLEVQLMAMEMARCIDEMDDAAEATALLAHKGDKSAKSVMDYIRKHTGGESNTSNDFRNRRENSEFDRGNSTSAWSEEGRSNARSEMNAYRDGYRDAMNEMNRGGRRGRSEMNESDFVLMPNPWGYNSHMPVSAGTNTNTDQVQAPILNNNDKKPAAVSSVAARTTSRS